MTAPPSSPDLLHRDGPTGLADYRTFDAALEQSVAKSRVTGIALAVIVLDLDDFKPINDACGRIAGDEFLAKIGERIGSALRESDLVARLGGDTFGILLGRLTEPDQAHRIAKRILSDISRPLKVGRLMTEPSASLGVAVFPVSGTSSDDLLQAAGNAMFAAKSAGKLSSRPADAVVVSQPPRALSSKSLEARPDSLSTPLTFRPLISLRGEVIAAEAETLSGSAPGESISLFPYFVLTQACAALQQWKSEWLFGEASSARIALRMSVHQLSALGVVNAMNDILAQTQTLPSEVEILLPTVGLEAASPELVKALSRLDQAGFHIVLDDFDGKSVSLLEALPACGVRLRLGTPKEVSLGGKQQRFVLGLVRLAHAMDLWVAAKNISTAEELDTMRELGCDRLQGSVIGEAREFDQFSWLSRTGRISGGWREKAKLDILFEGRLPV